MKRRDFLRGMAAGAGVAAAPLPALGRVAAAGTATNVATFHYGWACVFAQMNNGITPADVAEKFRIPLRDARGLFARMEARGVLHPPGLDGRSHATRPWQPWDKRAAAAQTERRKQRQAEQTDLHKTYARMMAEVTAALPTQVSDACMT